MTDPTDAVRSQEGYDEMSIKLLFAWYDFWIGAYWDRKMRRLYILPLPCVGVVISFEVKP